MKKVPNLSGMRQQHFSKPSPILKKIYIYKEYVYLKKERKRVKRKGKVGNEKKN